MSIDVKPQILANQIQQYIKKKMYILTSKFTQECKTGLTDWKSNQYNSEH